MKPDDRAARLAAALRENLRKRRAQAKKRGVKAGGEAPRDKAPDAQEAAGNLPQTPGKAES